MIPPSMEKQSRIVIHNSLKTVPQLFQYSSTTVKINSTKTVPIYLFLLISYRESMHEDVPRIPCLSAVFFLSIQSLILEQTWKDFICPRWARRISLKSWKGSWDPIILPPAVLFLLSMTGGVGTNRRYGDQWKAVDNAFVNFFICSP